MRLIRFYYKPFVFFIAVLLFASCGKGDFTPLPQFSFYPGECLLNEEMPQPRQTYRKDNRGSFPVLDIVFGFDFDVIRAKTFNRRKGFLPADEVWQSLGPEEDAVRNEFFNHWAKDVIFNGVPYYNEPIMVLNGEVTLTADKEFGDAPPGTNLIQDYFQIVNLTGSKIREVGIIDADMIPDDIPIDAVAVSSRPELYLNNKEGFRTSREDKAVLTLTIPVKVGMYLTCLKDRLTDPAAKMVFVEKTLSCTFPSEVKLLKE
ncbi:MAG: hypothetical protein J6X25_02805 [Bacteroidales bacterium]|nr:hypothetical protein [Bacteroidales bacterium]